MGSERGVVLIASALALVALCLFTGLIIDAGMLQQQRGQAQIAADSAAVAGAMQMLPGQNQSWAANAALDAAAWNGFRIDGATIVAVTPDGAGKKVRVRIARNVSTSFLSILGVRLMPVEASAIGAISKDGKSVVLAR
jgi:uncharacterized membrane protein